MRQKTKKKSLIIEAAGKYKGMIVDNKVSFEDWHIDGEFQIDNVKLSDDTKAILII